MESAIKSISNQLTLIRYNFRYFYLRGDRVKAFVCTLFILLFVSGCSATWSGVQQDTTDAVQWTKGQVNQGANYVKEKTE